jgi:hypothetical protein
MLGSRAAGMVNYIQLPPPQVFESVSSTVRLGEILSGSIFLSIWCMHVSVVERTNACNKERLTSMKYTRHTDKKENQIFVIYKEIKRGAVSKSYMRKGFLIYDECANISPYSIRGGR